MIYSVPIIIDEGVNPVFVKANRKILDTFEIENNDQLIDHWKRYFNACLDLDSKIIQFKTIQEKINFLMRFS